MAYTGAVNFMIKMRNELQAADMTLFTGKRRSRRPTPARPTYVNRMVYYADPDGHLPIGYVGLGDDRIIFPVTIIGDQDGPWDKNASKTDAFLR